MFSLWVWALCLEGVLTLGEAAVFKQLHLQKQLVAEALLWHSQAASLRVYEQMHYSAHHTYGSHSSPVFSEGTS